MTNEEIVSIIDASNLVSDQVLGELRDRLDKAKQPVDLKLAVKWLVQKEHVTSEQGKRLLSRAGGTAAGPAPAAPKKPVPAPDDDDLELIDEPAVEADVVDEGLELFPLGESAETGPAPAAKPAAGKAEKRWAGTPRSAEPKRGDAARSPARAAGRRPAAAPDDMGGLFAEPVGGATTGGADLIGAAAYGDAGFAQEAEEPHGKNKPKVKGNVWDSPLLLTVGGSLLALLILGGVLWWRLGRLTGDEAFRQAESFYKSGSYTQAVAQFDKYLKEFPEHSEVSVARVDRGMAQMRQAVEGARDWTKTLTTAQGLLDEIKSETAFGEARPELAALLPQIAEGLAKQAHDKPDMNVVERAEDALKLVDKYVSKSQRPTQKLADVQASLQFTRHVLGRDAALEKAVAGIKQAIEEGSPQAAYVLRRELVKSYPELAGNETLREAVLSLSKAEQSAVEYVPQPRAAEPADVQSPFEAELVMAVRRGVKAPGVAGRAAHVLAGGAVYGVDAESGEALWRRFVGFDTNYVPRPLSADPASDVLVTDSVRHEVLRVEGQSGKLRWRHVVGEPFDSHPVLARNHAWIATRTGRLLMIDLESGESPGFIKLPQPARVGPAFDSRGQVCFQLAENSNLYSLNTQTNQCQEVLYLGHDPESIHVPPLVISPYVFIAKDNGTSDSLLLVLSSDDRGTSLKQAQEPLSLAGHVFAPLQVAGRTLVVATDRGAIYTYEINPPDSGKPLTLVADKPAETRAPLIRYPLLRDAELWVAGYGLTKYDIQSSRGRLEPKWVKDETDAMLEPPTVAGSVVICARRRGSEPEVRVRAANGKDGTPYWEAELAAPAAGTPVSDAASGRLMWFNRLGALFKAPQDRLAGRVIENSPLLPDDPGPDLSGDASSASLSGDRLALSSRGGIRALVADAASSQAAHWINLPDPLAAPVIRFDEGLLAPGELGQIFVLDAATGESLVDPFQPKLDAEGGYQWTTPVAFGENEVLIADGRKTLYRLGISDKPQRHLVALAQADLPGPVANPLALLSKTVYAVGSDNELKAFGLPNLTPGKTWPLGAGLAWGPFAAGSCMLAATLDGKLLCIDDDQHEVWKTSWSHGALAGEPLLDGDAYFLGSQAGGVYRLSAKSGEELGMIDVGEPIAAGPTALGERLLLAGYGGTLMVVARP
ncbi:MAG TPA: PQQ-binding-like beta-propeller repeat protein [Pirellulales bacterium]|nr:PQQ-binding-like beta-propeller repeat protein [Pirellulales bacterium]